MCACDLHWLFVVISCAAGCIMIWRWRLLVQKLISSMIMRYVRNAILFWLLIWLCFSCWLIINAMQASGLYYISLKVEVLMEILWNRIIIFCQLIGASFYFTRAAIESTTEQYVFILNQKFFKWLHWLENNLIHAFSSHWQTSLKDGALFSVGQGWML